MIVEVTEQARHKVVFLLLEREAGSLAIRVDVGIGAFGDLESFLCALFGSCLELLVALFFSELFLLFAAF